MTISQKARSPVTRSTFGEAIGRAKWRIIQVGGGGYLGTLNYTFSILAHCSHSDLF